MHGSGKTTLIISNKEINGIIKIVQVLEDSNNFLKGFTKTIKNETEIQEGRFLGALRHFRINLAGKFIIMERNCKSWFW